MPLSVLLVGLLAATVDARVSGSGCSSSGSHAGKSGDSSHPHSTTSGSSKSKKSKRAKFEVASTTGTTSVARDSHGRIARSEAAKHDFKVQTGYPDRRR